MAITNLRPRHGSDVKSLKQKLDDHLKYDMNPDKTEDYKFLSTYECLPETAVEDFLCSKQLYQIETGRVRPPEKDVISYFVLQSFAPGEITPKLANEIGYKLAMEFTKGKHQFIVATHTDKGHIHTHVDFNSTNLERDGKFNNYWETSAALRKISDRLCAEYGLSVIKKEPKKDRQKNEPKAEQENKKGKSRGEWNAEKSGRSWKAQLKKTVDRLLPKSRSFEELMAKLEEQGYEIKPGKHISVRAPGQERFTRLKTLGEDYTEEALRSRVGKPTKDFSSLIDIDAKMAAGKNGGYEKWARVFNLKEFAKTRIFLLERGLADPAALTKKIDEVRDNFDKISAEIKTAEARMFEITTIKTHIVNFAKTKEIYDEYKNSKNKKEFREKHETEILLHESAKQGFDEYGAKKLPKISDLNTEYTTLLDLKKEKYSIFQSLKKELNELRAAKQNYDAFMGADDLKNAKKSKEETR